MSSVRWNYSHESIDRPEEPEYNVPIGHPSPPITAFGNIQYLDMIKMLDLLWTDSHPDISFQPLAENKEFNSEMGHIIYMNVHKVPSDGNNKPRHRHNWKDENGKSFTAFTQTFVHTIRFIAAHQDPNTADEILEAFEEFMMAVTPVLKKYGIEDIFYFQRISDSNQFRLGKDINTRSTEYRIKTQKVLTIENRTLEDYSVKLQVMLNNVGLSSTNNPD